VNYLQSYKLFESKFTDDYDLSKHNFNCGDCDVYAIALHRVYGYPLYIVNGYHKEEDWDEEEGYTEYDSEPAHIVVKLPNGNYMDSDGEVTEEQLKADCAFGNKIEYIKIEPITEQEAMYVYSGEDQEEDIERVVKYIKIKENISESLEKIPTKEDIQDLFVDTIDLGFDPVLKLSENGFKVILAKLRHEGITLDNIYDTLEVAEEYILDVYDKQLIHINTFYSCMNDSIRTHDLVKLSEINKNIVENYDNPFIWKVELYFDGERPIEEKPVSRVKKFFNLFKRK
jgi:hypothetical protein